MSLRPDRARCDLLPSDLPAIGLRHGQVIWLLRELGFQGAVGARTFNEYVKSLRKLGLPFPRQQKRRTKTPWLATYSYDHLIELALALSLRVYNGLPDAVLLELIRHRRELTRLYREAYLYRSSGVGAPVRVKGPTGSFDVRGALLDLQINYNGGTLTNFGPPRLLSPPEALEVFATSEESARAFLPVKLSALAERIVELSARAPSVRSGPSRASPKDAELPRSRWPQRPGNS